MRTSVGLVSVGEMLLERGDGDLAAAVVVVPASESVVNATYHGRVAEACVGVGVVMVSVHLWASCVCGGGGGEKEILTLRREQTG